MYRTIKVKCFSGEISGTAGLVSDYGIGVVCWLKFDCKHKQNTRAFFKIIAAYYPGCQTLFYAVSWLRLTAEDVSAFGQHRKFPPHARKTSGTQGSSLFEEVSKTRKKVSSDVKNQEVDGDLFFNLPLESKDQKANSQDFFHNELIFGQFIREKIDAS